MQLTGWQKTKHGGSSYGHGCLENFFMVLGLCYMGQRHLNDSTRGNATTSAQVITGSILDAPSELLSTYGPLSSLSTRDKFLNALSLDRLHEN